MAIAIPALTLLAFFLYFSHSAVHKLCFGENVENENDLLLGNLSDFKENKNHKQIQTTQKPLV